MGKKKQVDTKGAKSQLKTKQINKTAATKPLKSSSLGRRISLAKILPLSFWEQYVSQRVPTIVGRALDIKDFKKLKNWNLTHFQKLGSKAEVEVEVSKGSQKGFGRGSKEKMTFESFLQKLHNQREDFYLTTQRAELSKEGIPVVFSEPLRTLKNDITLQPEIVGNLVPQAINLWLGCSSEGTSSGLHTDFHDNLYILLRGKKSFQLWEPALVKYMYTHGTVKKVHHNGRIVFQEEGDVQADGSLASPKLDSKHFKDSNRRKKHRLAAETDSDAEEAALEAALGSAVSHFNNGTGEDWDFHDDFDDCSMGSGCEDEEPSQPPGFSQVDLTKSPEDIKAQFPDFPLQPTATCTLEAGELLYLPAGWFHYVTSLNSDNEGAGEDNTSYHMALNYWFHPPDNLDASASGFAKPYRTDFWLNKWRQHYIEH